MTRNLRSFEEEELELEDDMTRVGPGKVFWDDVQNAAEKDWTRRGPVCLEDFF
jgi:hypothetical protein